MSHRRKSRKSEEGSVAPVVMGLMVVLLTVGLGMLSITQKQSQSIIDDGKRRSALGIAEAGIDHVVWRLRQTPDAQLHYGPSWTTLADERDITVVNGAYYLKQLNRVNGQIASVDMQGWIPDRTSPNAVGVEVHAELAPVLSSPFTAAAFGDMTVSLGNGNTDSYDSRVATYPATLPPRQNGDVGTNATGAGKITIGPNGVVKGDVTFPSGVSSGVVSNGGTVTGTIGPDVMDRTFTAVPTPPSTSILVKPVNASGQTVASFVRASDNSVIGSPIPPGDYVIQASGGSSISLSGQAQLNFSGTGVTRLWTYGNIDIGGNGVANAAQLPPNLIIYGMGPDSARGIPGTTSVSVHGNGQFHGALYAPKADITISGGGSSGDVFGSMVGKSVTFNGNGTSVHYDEALATSEGGISRYKLTTWTQIK